MNEHQWPKTLRDALAAAGYLQDDMGRLVLYYHPITKAEVYWERAVGGRAACWVHWREDEEGEFVYVRCYSEAALLADLSG